MMPAHSTRPSAAKKAQGPIALLLLIGVALVLAAPASAQPKVPELGGTYPSSPGVSTTPRVFGWVGEVVISKLGGAGPISRAPGGEEGSITIYATPDCTGPVAATGSASQLENSGIQVTVPLASVTTFSATNSDIVGPSACSNPIEYRQVNDPPALPAITGVDPASPADDNTPHVLGSADIGSTVAIYSNSSCAGTPAAIGSAAEFAAGGIAVNVADNSTNTFFARASWAELPSPCSATSVTYQEVTATQPGSGGGEGNGGGGNGGAGPPASGGGASTSLPPSAPKLHTVPGGRSSNSVPLVTGSASGAVLVRIYKNAACGGRPAASGSTSQLADGFAVEVAENETTRFYGEAIDAAGKVSECSDEVPYVEDSSPPLTRITFGPGVKTRKRVAVFRFADITDDPPGTTFRCKFDRRPWKACQAPLKLPRLRVKVHTLRVKAIDTAGNEEAGGASRRFKVIRGV